MGVMRGNRDVTADRESGGGNQVAKWSGRALRPQEQCTWDSVREPVYTEARECLRAPSRGTVASAMLMRSQRIRAKMAW